MKKKKDIITINEQKIIACYILKGMTLKQIAKRIKCAKSTVSYKTKRLFKEYGAEDRNEFVINIFTKIIAKYKAQVQMLQNELDKYK